MKLFFVASALSAMKIKDYPEKPTTEINTSKGLET
jgi:hypothetical protein